MMGWRGQRKNGRERELLFYMANAKSAAERARADGMTFILREDPDWKVYRQYARRERKRNFALPPRRC